MYEGGGVACSYISYLPCLYVLICRSKIDFAGNVLSQVGHVKSCTVHRLVDFGLVFVDGDADGESNVYCGEKALFFIFKSELLLELFSSRDFKKCES